MRCVLVFSIILVSFSNNSQVTDIKPKFEYLDSSHKLKKENVYFDSGSLRSEKILCKDNAIQIKHYSEKGILIADFNYNLVGDQVGIQKTFYNDGALKLEEFIYAWDVVKEKQGKRIVTMKVISESYREFYENGKIMKEGTYKKGKKTGLYREYFEDGKQKSIEYFD